MSKTPFSNVFYEQFTLGTENPVSRKITGNAFEAFTGGIPEADVKVIYPLVRAMNSNKITRNFTLYPPEALKTPKNYEKTDPTGFASWVYPYAKPVIAEHKLQDDGWGSDACPPFGRIIASTYQTYKQEGREAPRPHYQKGYPGFVEGDGALKFITAIGDPTAIERILNNSYHTVSIGSRVESVIESTTGVDLIKASREDGQMPNRIRGQIYDNQLSYYSMYGLRGDEVSYVNNPSDILAGNEQKDLTADGVRLLLGEKKAGTKEFSFYDARTNEKCVWDLEETALDESYFSNTNIDSVERGRDTWSIGFGVKESYSTVQLESMVTWGPELKGKVVAVLSEGIPSIVSTNIKATAEDPIAIIRVYKAGKPTETHVAHKVKALKLVGENI